MPELVSEKSTYMWRDRFAHSVIYLVALLVSAAFVWIAGDLVRGGIAHVSWDFLIDSPRNAGRAGGIGPILVSTGLILLVALIVALPLGWMTAALLAEYIPVQSGFGHGVRYSLQVLAGVPSI